MCGTKETFTTFSLTLFWQELRQQWGALFRECVQGCLPEVANHSRTCHTDVDIIVRLSKLILEQDAVHA